MCAVHLAPREITSSKDYVEGPLMVKRRGKYYLMWSEGGWADGSYLAAYGVSDHPPGPFEYGGRILENHPEVAQGAGHHLVLQLPGTDDEWVICYHRLQPHPLHRPRALHRLSLERRPVQ